MTTTETLIKNCKNLANSLTNEDLTNFIVNENSRFNTERANDFLKWLENLNGSKDSLLLFKIRVALICSKLFYSYEFYKEIREDLSHYISIQKENARIESEKRFEEQKKAKFKEMLVKLYKGEITHDQIELAFNPNQRNFYTDYRATVKKVENKLQTKSHSLEKVLKVIEEDIERGYHNSIQMGEAIYREYQKRSNSHWFWY